MRRAGQDDGLRVVAVPLFAMAVFVTLASRALHHSYTYDESVTVGFFVEQSNLLDAVTSQRVFNNHPLLTAANWLVHQLGGDAEMWQRTVPLFAGAACVALVSWWSTRNWGLLAGIGASAFVAVNPLLLELSVQARGYSLAALAATLAFVLAHCEQPLATRKHAISFVAVVASGLLAHLYFAIALAGLVASSVQRDPAASRKILGAALLGLAIAAPVYAAMLPDMVQAAGERAGSFVPGFPVDVAEAVLGTPTAMSAALLLVLMAMTTAGTTARTFSLTALALIVSVWVVIRPLDIYPRFLVWAVPLLGILVAAAVHRDRRLFIVPVAVVIISVPAALDRLASEPDIRTIAATASRIENQGFDVCTGGWYWESYEAYGHFEPVTQNTGCALVITRLSDLPQTDGLTTAAAIPGTRGTCIIAAPATLEAVALEPGTCGAVPHQR